MNSVITNGSNVRSKQFSALLSVFTDNTPFVHPLDNIHWVQDCLLLTMNRPP